MKILVRDMLPEEAGQVAALHDQIHALHVQGRPDLFAPNNGDATGLMQWHQAPPDKRVLVAVCDATIYGYAVIQYLHRDANPYMQVRRSIHVEEICVDKAHQRSGAGRALMQFIYEDARQRCYPRVELDVWDFNEEARHFYSAMGMQEFRHYLELPVLPHRFAPVTVVQAEAATQLYHDLKGLPGGTWDEYYPNRDIVDADIQSGALFGALEGDELIAVGAALPDQELTHLDGWTLPSENPCVLSRIGVKRSHQGQGLARQMVRYMEEEMQRKGHDVARLLVSPHNEKALHVYQGCGYQACGSTRMYEEDWLYMEKQL